MTIRPRKLWWCLAAQCLLLGAPQSVLAQVEAQHEFLLFPSIGVLDTQDESDASVKNTNSIVSADVLYSYSSDQFRFLAEYLLSTEEAELERLQAGWAVSDDAMLWLGRFHSPSRYWMSEFHHGQFMQTSITRPSMEAWEDESGNTPSHITGLMFEFGKIRPDNSVVEYLLSAGLAPKFSGDELLPYDFLDSNSGHGLSLNARVSYRPEYFDSTTVGLVGSWNEINAVPATTPGPSDLQSIDQLTAGFFANWQLRELRLITSVTYYDQRLTLTGDEVSEDFVLAYVQPEYELNDDVTVFGRIDVGFGEDSSIYLRMLPGFIAHRNMLGIRWDFADMQALTMELADTSKQGDGESHLHYKEFRLQWSAAFP